MHPRKQWAAPGSAPYASSTGSKPASSSGSDQALALPRGAWGRNDPKSQEQNPEKVSINLKTAIPVWENQKTASGYTSSSSDEGPDSGNEEGESGFKANADLQQLEDSIFLPYLGVPAPGDSKLPIVDSEGEDPFHTGLEKIREHLTASQSGAAACLICLEKIRAADPVWSCLGGCHCTLHLPCIQSWARQSASSIAARAVPSPPLGALPLQLPEVTAERIPGTWQCPKCRSDYSPKDLPREYRCYCGKERDPPYNPWLAPHTCGETCGRQLAGGCNHRCTLLCHPGPCPPCPQLVRAKCHCGKRTQPRRCGQPAFSCTAPCSRLLACGAHACPATCHPGDCPPCPRQSRFFCRCGAVEDTKDCADRDFGCGKPCGRQLPCGRHVCEVVCHSGNCGDCPLAGKRHCPCGKTAYGDVPCHMRTPTCGGTCEKLLSCQRHPCPERCHTGPCTDMCRVVVRKACRCGGTIKEVACCADVACERRCQRGRNCGRHLCKRRCCNGNCPPCAEVCAKRLRCHNHKCPAPCHTGPCAPCPVTVRIACSCGATAFSVPCGMEKDQRPPKCSKHCQIPPTCRHGADCKPHRCHYGACPPCQLVCGAPLSCEHTCPDLCHGPRPPPNPAYTLRLSKKKKGANEADAAGRQGCDCLPCVVPVVRRCLGNHQGQERTMPCSNPPNFSCGTPCGNPLACSNHSCRRACHSITFPRDPDGSLARPGGGSSQSSSLTGNGGHIGTGEGSSGQPDVRSPTLENEVDGCEECQLACQKPRDPPCAHPCPEACHPGECRPCSELVKRTCHCGALTRVLDCHVVGRATPAELDRLVSCNGPCHRKLKFCAHLCPETCHPGACPRPAECRKKVAVRCACQRLKKEWLCQEVQAAEAQRVAGKGGKVIAREGILAQRIAGVGLLPCDSECMRLAKERADLAAREEAELLRQHQLAADAAKAQAGGVRRRRQRAPAVIQRRSSWIPELPPQVVRWGSIVLYLLLAVLLLGCTIYAFLELSRYMNSLDARRPRRRLRTPYRG